MDPVELRTELRAKHSTYADEDVFHFLAHGSSAKCRNCKLFFRQVISDACEGFTTLHPIYACMCARTSVISIQSIYVIYLA